MNPSPHVLTLGSLPSFAVKGTPATSFTTRLLPLRLTTGPASSSSSSDVKDKMPRRRLDAAAAALDAGAAAGAALIAAADSARSTLASPSIESPYRSPTLSAVITVDDAENLSPRSVILFDAIVCTIPARLRSNSAWSRARCEARAAAKAPLAFPSTVNTPASATALPTTLILCSVFYQSMRSGKQVT